jgi:hypothetical protein
MAAIHTHAIAVPRSVDIDETPTPVCVPAWRAASLHSAEFATLAEFLSRRLQRLSHSAARALANQLAELADEFREWQRDPPTDEDRVAMLRRLSNYHQLASDLLCGSR